MGTRITDFGKTLGPGAMLGEIGVFAQHQERTATVVCRADCRVYELSESDAKQLYFRIDHSGVGSQRDPARPVYRSQARSKAMASNWVIPRQNALIKPNRETRQQNLIYVRPPFQSGRPTMLTRDGPLCKSATLNNDEYIRWSSPGRGRGSRRLANVRSMGYEPRTEAASTRDCPLLDNNTSASESIRMHHPFWQGRTVPMPAARTCSGPRRHCA
jgi:Cyclic nucleotide-binding domain